MRTIVAEDRDGSQVLVSIYDTSEVEVAKRDSVGDLWGPPLEIHSDEEDYSSLRKDQR